MDVPIPGVLIVDDMTPMPDWSDEQRTRQDEVRRTLLSSPLLTSAGSARLGDDPEHAQHQARSQLGGIERRTVGMAERAASPGDSRLRSAA